MPIPKLIRYQDNQYLGIQGTLLEGFETFADWAITGTGATGSGDSTHRKQGLQSLRLNSVNGSLAMGTKTISEDLSAPTNFVFWVYVDDDTDLVNFEYISLLFSSTSDWSKYFVLRINSDHHKHGWNRFVLHKAAFTNTGAESWSNTMIRLRVQCEANDGKNVSVCFDDLRYNHGVLALCMLIFDDGHSNVYDNAKPKMDTNSQPGVAFVITDEIGSGGSLTKVQLTAMQTAGWDISNHSYSHLHLADIPQVAMENDIDNAYDWLIENGFTNGARFFAYPYGEYNRAVITQVKEHHRIARSVIDGAFQPHFNLLDDDQDFVMKTKVVEASISAATVCGWIDDAILQKGLLPLSFHGVVASGAVGSEYNKADFETISDYLLTKVAQMPVITFSDYYDQFISSVVYLEHGPLVPYPIAYTPSESVGRAEDRKLKVYKHPLAGDRKRIFRIKCIIDDSGSSGYKWRDLEYFYTKVVEGAKRRCIFVDANSVQYLVRIIDFSPKAIGLNNRHEVTMILEEDYS